MRSIIYKIFISLFLFLVILLFYLSTIGIKTDKFNYQIISQIKQIEPNLELKLNDVSASLDLFNFEIDAKTIGTDLIYRDKIIKIETIKSKISIKSFFKKEFALNKISVSSKSLAINDLVAFARLFNNNPKLFIFEQLIEKGYIVADLNLEFDETGKLKDNFNIKGLINDGQISFFKKYNLAKINFDFEIDKKNFTLNDIRLSFNNKNILMPQILASNQNGEYLISGKLITKNLTVSEDDIKNLINKKIMDIDIYEVLLNTENNFTFNVSNNFKIKNLNIKSDINLENLKVKNFLNLDDVLPKAKESFIIKNHKIKLDYKKDKLIIDGKGEIFLQDESDEIQYKIDKRKKKFFFDLVFNSSKNPFKLDLLNYQKRENLDLEIKLSGMNDDEKKLIFNEISFKEKNNIILIKNLIFSKNYQINSLDNVKINYLDKDELKNNFHIKKNGKNYLVKGKSFNINKIIDKLLDNKNKKKLNIFKDNIKLVFDIDKIYLDKTNTINNLDGYLKLNENEIVELNLESKFSDQKNIRLTIKTNDEEKITTLYSHKAKPFVDRYKFVNGFEEGDLDFYSIKKNGKSNSILKIDNFKIKEIPVLAKILTLASLQGIADLLTGEGIRFSDFEMKFSSVNKLMTIEEMYAIGPAISILMEGYLESDKLISLRGTLVPATTINRTISSIPLIGDILVGQKVGEGVFGVSFKIKGPPKKLETTVNPIKTLTPRFITRTLEKIKKN